MSRIPLGKKMSPIPDSHGKGISILIKCVKKKNHLNIHVVNNWPGEDNHFEIWEKREENVYKND